MIRTENHTVATVRWSASAATTTAAGGAGAAGGVPPTSFTFDRSRDAEAAAADDDDDSSVCEVRHAPVMTAKLTPSINPFNDTMNE